MKIVPASFEILDHLDQQSLATRIEYCGRICYKSEDRITSESALPFIKNVIERGHNSVLEMGAVTLDICDLNSSMEEFFLCQPKYLHISRYGFRLLVTASIRAWREMLINHPDCEIVRAACALLSERHPYFFSTILPQGGFTANVCIDACKMPLEDVERLPMDDLVKHRHVAVKFIVSRAVSHEICRHRAMAILMESQRYCNYAYGKFGNEVTFIRPSAFWDCETSGECELCGCENQRGEFCDDCIKSMLGWYDKKVTAGEDFIAWLEAIQRAEDSYLERIQSGSSPQAARTVLPNSCKTELIVYANLEQWQHIFKLRCSKAAEPSMREVMIPLREEFAKRWPEVFENA